MFYRHSHLCHGQRFARGEHVPDGQHLGHGRHDRFSRGGGRSGLGRFFAHGDLRLVILHLIAEKPRHGYEIIKAIEEQVAGAYSPSPGVIYPTLTLLEELGYVTVSTGEGAKKLHAITAEGRAFLDANRATVDALLARMAEASRVHGGGPRAAGPARDGEPEACAAAAPVAWPAQRGAGQRRGRSTRRRGYQRGADLMGTHLMLSSEGRVPTAVPRRYLGQLCKHFEHKLPVTLAEDHGRIEFPAGVCTLDAEAETLVMRVTAGDDAALARLEDVVARHLERFAFRDKPEIRWTRTT